MSLMDDCVELLAFWDAYAYEMKNTKASEYKMGIGEGIEQAAEMLRTYLVEYPEFVDPKLELEKFKM